MSGELYERFRSMGGSNVRSRLLPAGWTGGFGPDHLHDLVPMPGTSTVSVHAYSPPLTSLTHYEWTSLGFVVREIVPAAA